MSTRALRRVGSCLFRMFLPGVCLLVAGVLPRAARAGGLLAQELANPRNGTAQAGQAAYAYDAATALYNPAGMVRLDAPETLLGLQPIWTDIEFDKGPQTTFSGGDGGQQGGFLPSLAAFYAHPLGERWALGASLAGISGGALDPANGWAGRFYVTELSLTVLALNPVVGFRVNDWLSLGAGVSINYGLMDFDLRLPPLTPGPEGKVEMSDVDDFAVSWNLGVLFEPTDTTRFGISYRSKVDLQLSGDIDVRGTPLTDALGLRNGDVDADVPIPQHVRASVYHQLNDTVALLADLGWEDWSQMDFTPISGPAGRSLRIRRDWHDTWHLGLGVEWRVRPDWLLQAGVAHDTSPVRNRRRNLPDMPVDRQWRFSAGVVHDLRENLRVALNYTYVSFGRAAIDVENVAGRLQGDYESYEAHVLGLSVAF